MTDQHRRDRHGGGDFTHIVYIIVDRQTVEMFAAATVAMTRERNGMSLETRRGEKRQVAFLPAPGGSEGTMHEQQWRRRGLVLRQVDKDFKFGSRVSGIQDVGGWNGFMFFDR